MSAESAISVPAADTGPRRNVLLVGAGIVNLITAWTLAREGYSCEIHDAGPEPDQRGRADSHGATHGGDNARMFTLTEADVYHRHISDGADPRQTLLDLPVAQGGWVICRPSSLPHESGDWVKQFTKVPLPTSDELHSEVINFNKEAGAGWQNLIAREPALFKAASLRAGILRIYSDVGTLQSQVERHRRIGALHDVLTTAQIATRYPALAGGCQNGVVAGGFTVTGFTVGIHALVQGLLDLLRQLGVRIVWNSRIETIEWADTSPRTVSGLRGVNGSFHAADHYVLSPGAYGRGLLRGTRSDGLIHGVLGAWIRVPNIEPRLETSLKVKYSGHMTPDFNVTVVQGDELIIGSGYGWTGPDPENVDPDQLEQLYLGVEAMAEQYFPQAVVAARRDGALRRSRRTCVRPWTPTNLGVFERYMTESGGSLIVTGGHNTGGFSQAPVVGAAVASALLGTPHSMEHRFAPDRRVT